MKPVVRKSVAEQTADWIRERLREGLWQGRMPGVLALSREFDVSKHAVRGALKLLVAQGILKDGGTCRARCLSEGGQAPAARILRIGILPSMPVHEDNAFSQRLTYLVRENIAATGHVGFIAGTTFSQLKYDPRRVVRFMRAEKADGWIFHTATRDILEALVSQNVPIYSLGGDFANLPVAGSGAVVLPGLEQTVDRLVALGHRRIAAICPKFWRHPKRGPTVNAFLEILEARGIAVGDYNVPEWEESKDGLETMLAALFKVTPPTALLVVEPSHTVAVLSFLARNRLLVPKDVSIMAMMTDPALEWHTPAISTMNWPLEKHAGHIQRWLKQVAREGRCHDQATFMTSLIDGETIAPARTRSPFDVILR